MGYPTQDDTMQDIVRKAHDNAARKGFWDGAPLDAATRRHYLAAKLALIHSEVSEALEDLRKGAMETTVEDSGKPVGFPTELADIVIRVADLAGYLGIDLGYEVDRKMEYNTSRPKMHGKKL